MRREAGGLMGAASITQTDGRDWWLQRTDPSGRQRYPERIRVGKLDAPRVYVPERTCKMVDNGSELCCSVCDWRHDHDDEPAYCSGCGAKVVSE